MTYMTTALIFLAAMLPAAAATGAEPYPERPVRMVVPLTAGSGADIAARIVGKHLNEMWKQPVVVDNRPGAGGQIGTQIAVRAVANGYTLLVQSSSHAANPAIYKSLPYDPLKDLVDVALLGTSPYVMVGAPAGPYTPLKSLIDAARKKPSAIPFASAGVGTASHLTAEYFTQSAALKMLHVPFKGSPEAIVDVAAGRVSFYMAPISTVIGLLGENRIAALGVTTSARVSMLPNVPTLAEQGVAGFDMNLWFGVWAPAATRREVLRQLETDIRRALQSAEIRAQYAKVGIEPGTLVGADFAKFVRSEISKYRQIVKQADIQPL